MTVSTETLKTSIVYPDSDGEPMAESDPARDYLIYAVEALNIYFQDQKDVYVSGNLFIYYRQGSPSAVVAPDAFVVQGVPKKKRMSYKVWEENNQVPSFVLEITSLSTQDNDEKEKPRKYAEMGVKEYFQYDPTGDYLSEVIKGRKLKNGIYQPLAKKVLKDGVISIYSQVLGLDLRVTEGELRFYEPSTNRKLLSPQETELARQQAELARQQAELERQQAELARQQVEQEKQQVEQEKQQVEQEKQQVEQEKQQLESSLSLAITRLNSLGLTTEAIAETLNISVTKVKTILG
jgi:Uma2 family endonuclease